MVRNVRDLCLIRSTARIVPEPTSVKRAVLESCWSCRAARQKMNRPEALLQ